MNGRPEYLGWRGELIARLALARAGLIVQEIAAPHPFDFLAAMPDGSYFLVEVRAFTSIRGDRRKFQAGEDLSWRIDGKLL